MRIIQECIFEILFLKRMVLNKKISFISEISFYNTIGAKGDNLAASEVHKKTIHPQKKESCTTGFFFSFTKITVDSRAQHQPLILAVHLLSKSWYQSDVMYGAGRAVFINKMLDISYTI